MAYFTTEDGSYVFTTESGSIFTTEDHSAIVSLDDIAVVTTILVAEVQVTSSVYRDGQMATTIRTIEDENRIIAYGEFKEWNASTEVYDYFDPTDGVYVVVEEPSGVETTYQYTVDTEVTKNATGKYQIKIDVESAGYWYFRWYCDGTEKGSDEQKVRVIEVETST